jgi:hypothetical protein
MGSFIVRNYMARYGTGVEGIILAGTGTPTKAELLFGKCLTGVIGKVKGTKYVSKLVDNISTKSYMSGIENAKTEHDWLTTDEEMVEKFESGVYVADQGDDIAKRGEIRAENDAVVASDVATLWAKAMSTRQAILQEDDNEQYNSALEGGASGEDEANMEKLLVSQQMLSLLSARRVNRILELRSYMLSAPSTRELVGHSKESQGNSGE